MSYRNQLRNEIEAIPTGVGTMGGGSAVLQSFAGGTGHSTFKDLDILVGAAATNPMSGIEQSTLLKKTLVAGANVTIDNSLGTQLVISSTFTELPIVAGTNIVVDAQPTQTVISTAGDVLTSQSLTSTFPIQMNIPPGGASASVFLTEAEEPYMVLASDNNGYWNVRGQIVAGTGMTIDTSMVYNLGAAADVPTFTFNTTAPLDAVNSVDAGLPLIATITNNELAIGIANPTAPGVLLLGDGGVPGVWKEGSIVAGTGITVTPLGGLTPSVTISHTAGSILSGHWNINAAAQNTLTISAPGVTTLSRIITQLTSGIDPTTGWSGWPTLVPGTYFIATAGTDEFTLRVVDNSGAPIGLGSLGQYWGTWIAIT